MTSMNWFALGMAVFGAFSYATGSILQAIGAKRSHSTASTLGHPLYLIGIVFDIVAWIGAIAAPFQVASALLFLGRGVGVPLAEAGVTTRNLGRNVLAGLVRPGQFAGRDRRRRLAVPRFETARP